MNVKLYLKRKIAAAHYLPNYEGDCSKMHGHTWLVEVWLEGRLYRVTGMLIDFRLVKCVIDSYDHCTLNEVLPEDYQPPTAEHLAAYFLNIIPYAVKVRVWESEYTYAEVGHAT